ncbi:hypothetical protein SCLCIDRAFT_644078 [Scleroderma citrinum Foug A]|uniref:Uncharacterized protein n=1 Tax=Scleroderma citrinum Foug A TaxID=1036808 RepID=A0A0C3AHB2_9AGAM|nr:hypothetical protein SCLCIDRAFT_644078 [Scleroderma citrinum Foug A]
MRSWQAANIPIGNYATCIKLVVPFYSLRSVTEAARLPCTWNKTPQAKCGSDKNTLLTRGRKPTLSHYDRWVQQKYFVVRVSHGNHYG